MYSRRTNVDMWRNGNSETNPPWYVAHVWPINVCLCGRRGILGGQHLDMFFLVRCGCCHCSAWSGSGFHLLPLHCIPSSRLRQIGTWTLPPSELSAMLQQMEEKQAVFFLLLAPAHILRTATGFSILVVSVERRFSENDEAFSEHKIQLFWGTGQKKNM